MVAAPPITHLSLLDEDSGRPLGSWHRPFKKLLTLLGNINGSNIGIRNHHFCFQHTHDLSEVSKVFLSVSLSPEITYEINTDDTQCEDFDFDSVTISRGVTHEIATDSIRFDESNSSSGQAFVAELEEYAKRVLSRTRVSVLVHDCIKSLTQGSGEIEDYCGRLIENDIIHDTGPFHRVNLVTCPLCYSPLWSCEECDATVVCSNGDCAGSHIVDCKTCVAHERMACHQCLDSKAAGSVPSFVRCWTCGSWCCRKDVSWCPGRIIHPTPSEELVNLSKESNFDSKLIVRSHSPKPGSCQSCINSGYADEWISCSGRQSVLCPSSGDPLSQFCFGGNGVYCAECITQENICACGEVWFCNTCAADPSSYPYIISCPRCGARYRNEEDGCKYCHFCCVCRQPGVCFGCQARDEGDVEGEDTSGEGSQPLDGYEPCLKCGSSICEECCSTGGDGVVQCPGCQSWMCAECANGEELMRCDYCLHEDLGGTERFFDVSTTALTDIL